MANKLISDLTALTGANTAVDDSLPIYDLSATTTKQITRQEFQTYAGGTVTVSTPLTNYTQTWNAGGVTFTANLTNVTDTASAAASKLQDYQVGGVSKFALDKNGAITNTDGITCAGVYGYCFTASSGNAFRADASGYAITNGAFSVRSTGVIRWSSDTTWYGAQDTGLSRISAGVVGLGNGTAADVTGQLNMAKTTIATGTITTSQPAVNASQTWNAGAVPFTANLTNVTDTASTVASLLNDWQIGGTSKLAIDKAGRVYFRFGGSYYPRIEATADYTIGLNMTSAYGAGIVGNAYQGFKFEFTEASMTFGVASVDNSMVRAAANSQRWAGGTTATTTSRTQINKSVTGIADATGTATFTVTVPNAAHSAMLKVTLIGSLGAGGAIGANEATGTISYDISIARTTGVNAVATISTAYGSATSAVAGAATITVAGALSAISGAVGATNTFTVNVTITKGSGASANHTCLCYGRLMNANATGITIA